MPAGWIDGLEALAATDLAAVHGTGLESRSVVAVGVFDGVHLGHQRLLHELLEFASELGGLPTVVTFKDHPDRLLRGEAPPLLVSVPHRIRLLHRAGVRRIVVLDFDARLRAYSAQRFTEEVLVRGLRTCGLLLGYDSALGKDREGTPALFREFGARYGFAVRESQPFLVDGQRVSSTAIRAAIAAGDLDRSHRLLGRWPSAFGTVIEGDHRGRALGFPTANLLPQSSVLPPNGVYAAEAIRDEVALPAVANLGVRPTFLGDDSTPLRLLEVHVLDFRGDLYGQTLEVAFRASIRAERRFPDIDQLRAQIARDVARTREFLAP